MRKVFILLLCLVLMPSLLHAGQEYLEVTGQGNKPVSLVIAAAKSLGGAQDGAVSREIEDVLSFDLTLAGPFSVTKSVPGEARSGIRPGEFDFAPWRAVGAAYLVKTGYTITGDTVVLECRLYDVAKERSLAAKRFTGKRKDLRLMTHGFSDEVMLAVTGERGPFTGRTAFVSRRSGNKEIYVMDYDGHNVQKITRNGSINLNPDVSPNRHEIIYTSYRRGNPDLYRIEINSRAEARISSRQGVNFTGAWSPDGNKIALAMSKDGNSEIYLIARDGRQLARLTKNDAIDISPTWSPDGTRIAFVSDRLGGPQVFIMNADGSNPHRLTHSGAYNVSPRWSPKGDRILYSRQQAGGFQIHAINPDGSGDTQLTSEGRNEYPHWSPDGRFVTFASNRSGGEAIYVMRADGSGQTKVSHGGSSDSQPVWSAR